MLLLRSIGKMFNPVDFYHLASELYKQADLANDFPAEALYRSIISRAYYSAFLAARNKCQLKNCGASVHQLVIDHCREHHKPVIANRLEDLKERRTKADYTDKSFSKREAGEALKLALQILKSLGYLC